MIVISSPGPIGATGPAGVAGDTGPTGPTGPAFGAIIPFSNNGSITPSTNSSGDLIRTNLLGFGDSSGNVTVSKVVTEDDTVFQFTLGSNDEFITIPMPYDGKITTVAGRYSTTATWSPTCDMRLYIAVAIAPRDSTLYTIIPSSKALAPVFERGVSNSPRTVRTGIASDLDIVVKEGENIAVIAGYDTANGTLNQLLPFNFTGSIVIMQS